MRCIDGTTYITVEEAAGMLGISARTIQRWLSEPHKPKHAPELKPFRFPDGKIYFKQEAIRCYYCEVLGTELSESALIALLNESKARRTRLVSASA